MLIFKHHNNHFRRPAITVSLVMLMILLAGCNLPFMPVTAPTLSATSTSLLPLNTSSPIPPTLTPTSTLTPTPSETSTPSPISIVFASGTTAAVEQGSIQPNQIQSYTLSAGQNQPMILILTSSNNDSYLGVFEPDGNKLLDPAKKWNNWQWLLPKTELYTIQVFGGATSENYTLTAKVAQRITFVSGASSATLVGSTPKGYVISYALACQANQVIAVSLNVPATTAYLDIFGLATGTLLSSSAKLNSWTGKLPATQDYIIEVIPMNGQVINYSLIVTVN